MDETWNHQFAEVNGVRLHYVREGSGTPLILVHGWPGFWFEWNKNIRSSATLDRYWSIEPQQTLDWSIALLHSMKEDALA